MYKCKGKKVPENQLSEQNLRHLHYVKLQSLVRKSLNGITVKDE